MINSFIIHLALSSFIENILDRFECNERIFQLKKKTTLNELSEKKTIGVPAKANAMENPLNN